MNIKAAIFDMDGTLINSLIFWDELWTAFGERYLNDKTFRPTKEDDKKVRTLILKDAMELIHKNYHIGENGAELLNYTNQLLAEFYNNKVELKEGVREFLEHLLKSGVKMCVATATEAEYVDLAMKRLGLEKYFLKLFSCGDIGKGKEEPDIFLLAQNFLGSSVEETWVFEDSLVSIETATKIGMPTVGIYDAYNFGQEQIKQTATKYIDKNETLLKLINQ